MTAPVEIGAAVAVRDVQGIHAGVVIGRTFEESPRYDVALPDGSTLVNVDAEYVSEDGWQ